MTWRESAACRNHDPEVWFDPNPGAGPRGDPWALPRSICQHACPVTTQCLTTALDDREAWGVWGGLDPEQRRQLLKETP